MSKGGDYDSNKAVKEPKKQLLIRTQQLICSAWVTAGFSLDTWNVGWIRLIVDGRGADDTGDGKWPHVPGCKLTCAASDGDVLGREPHALSNPVGGSRSPPPVSLLLHTLHRSD